MEGPPANDNPAATAFWRRAIPYAYTESSTDDEIFQVFDSSAAPESRPPRVGSSVSLVVRPGTESDLKDVLRLWKEAGAEPTRTDDLAALAMLVSHDPDALLVAETGGLVVGSVIAAWDGWRGSIYRLVVYPNHRRQGVGSQLLGAAEAALEARRCRRAQAIVVGSDQRAMEFWSSTKWHLQQDRRRFVWG